ncbi:MAG: hypothetical protein EOM67_12870 [Spirochaetia bacterium]|nr:hypothetical protein [Spirochaetia bacterium]
MKQVLFTYDDGSQTRHNAKGTSITVIIKLVGETITSLVDAYDTQTKEMKSTEIQSRIVKAEIF